MRTGRERRSARERRARVVGQRRIVILVAVLVIVPLVAIGVLAGVFMLSLRAVASVEQDLPELEDQGEVTLEVTDDPGWRKVQHLRV